MPAYRKPTFPPLFEHGLTEIQLADLDQVFVGRGYDTPLRKRLTQQLRLFIHHLSTIGVHGTLWIDGSFATKKPNPADIDVVLVIPPGVVSAMADNALARFDYLTSDSGHSYVRRQWQIDLYAIRADDSQGRHRFLNLFSLNPDRQNLKGIPYLQL